eukprot:298787_1
MATKNIYHAIQQSETIQLDERKENIKIKARKTKIFISGQLKIEKIETVDQMFTVTGYINCFWRGNHVLTRKSREKYKHYGPFNKRWKYIDDCDKYKIYAKEAKNNDDYDDDDNEENQLIDKSKTSIFKPISISSRSDNLTSAFGGEPNHVESTLVNNQKYQLRYIELYQYNDKNMLIPTDINTSNTDDELEIKEDECLFWQYLIIRGTFSEFFEMEQFPFDKQFLNIPIKLRHGFKPMNRINDLNVNNIELLPGVKCGLFECKLLDSIW